MIKNITLLFFILLSVTSFGQSKKALRAEIVSLKEDVSNTRDSINLLQDSCYLYSSQLELLKNELSSVRMELTKAKEENSALMKKNYEYSKTLEKRGNGFFAKLNNDTYLQNPYLETHFVEKKIKAGSVIWFTGLKEGEYDKVMTISGEDGHGFENFSKRWDNTFFIKKPQFTKTQGYSEVKVEYVAQWKKNTNFINSLDGGCILQTEKGYRLPVRTSYCPAKISKYRSESSYKSSSYKRSSKSECSSTQCVGRTKKGRRCKKRTTNCSGRCYLH